jgi:hypothetical protein
VYKPNGIAVVGIVLLVCCVAAPAQKVKTGFDKSAVFSGYKTYTWTEGDHVPSNPLLAQMVIGYVDGELESKGLKRVEKDGDLLLAPTGGFDQEFGTIESTPAAQTGVPGPYVPSSTWSGPLSAASSGISPTVDTGSLTIAMIDRNRSRLVWEGSVTEKLDRQRKQESLDRIHKAIAKLFKEFPPQKR